MPDEVVQPVPEVKVKKRFSGKKLVAILLAVLAIAGASFFYIYYTNQQKSKYKVDMDMVSSKVDEISSMANNVKEGQNYLDSEIAKTNNPKYLSMLYLKKSDLANSIIGGHDRKEALEYAYKAETVLPSSQTALIIASTEDMQGDIKNAIKYYKLYLSRASKHERGYDYYVLRLSQLEAIK